MFMFYLGSVKENRCSSDVFDPKALLDLILAEEYTLCTSRPQIMIHFKAMERFQVMSGFPYKICPNCLITSSFHVFVVALFIMKHLKTMLKQVEQINSISTTECTNRCQTMREVEGAKAFFKNRRACPFPSD